VVAPKVPIETFFIFSNIFFEAPLFMTTYCTLRYFKKYFLY